MRNIINRKKIIISIIHAIVLSFATYLIWNIPDDWNDSGSWLQKIQIARSLFAKPDTLPNDLVLINTSYDHVMVSCYDEANIERGQLDITDRAKLLKLFKWLERENDYKYIVCDISFDKELITEYDNELYSQISHMPRCCVVSTEEVSIPQQLHNKSAMSEYHTNILNNNFLKYQYLTPLGESVALKMAHELNGVSISQHGPIYLYNGKPCINSYILDIKTNITNEYQDNGDKNILQLGCDILPIIDAQVPNMFTNKIVMIGDCLREDIHTTVAGNTSGMMIIYNAYHSIRNQLNVPSVWLWTFILILYFFLTIAILICLEPHGLLPQKWLQKKPVLSVAVDWIGFQVLFTFLGISSFLIAGSYIDAWICASYFTLLNSIYKHYRS